WACSWASPSGCFVGQIRGAQRWRVRYAPAPTAPRTATMITTDNRRWSMAFSEFALAGRTTRPRRASGDVRGQIRRGMEARVRREDQVDGACKHGRIIAPASLVRLPHLPGRPARLRKWPFFAQFPLGGDVFGACTSGLEKRPDDKPAKATKAGLGRP